MRITGYTANPSGPDRLEGFKTITAANGKEAVEIATIEKPDLILNGLCDAGYGWWQGDASLASSPNTPILAMTALCWKSDLQGCIDPGCNDYIVKPFQISELQRKIKAMIPWEGDRSVLAVTP